MDFTLRQLRIFVKVAEYESVTKAADALFLSQPAVSIQLKKLQEQFEVPLTEVIGRRLFVTDFGKEVVSFAERVLNDVDAMEYYADAFRGKVSGRLRLSIASTAKYVMPFFLADFMARHPAVDLSMDVTNKRQVVGALEQNEVDFAMVSVLPAHLELNTVRLMANKLFLVVGSRRPHDAHPKSIKALAGQPLLFRETGSATRAAMENFLTGKQLPAFKKIELTSNEALKQAVVAGLGYSIMPLIGIKNELLGGQIEIIPMKGLPIVTEWDLVWLKSKNLSPVAQSYLDFISSEKERIIEKDFSWISGY